MKGIYGLSLDDIIETSSEGIFKIPAFQREFQWTQSQICIFAESALQGLPCGSIVTWEGESKKKQFPDANVIRILQNEKGKTDFINFPGKAFLKNKNPRYVIDGLQRVTAICVAFGGLKNKNSNFKYGGKFYINLNHPEMSGSVSFLKDKEIESRGLNELEEQTKQGLFPLNSNELPLSKVISGSLIQHWAKIVSHLEDGSKSHSRATDIISAVSQGIISELVIDKSKTLADVADNFEKLNTQGTPVSMIDVMHSVLYEWFSTNKKINFNLRDWVDDICDNKGTRGWGREKKRQIIAQLVVGTDLSLSNRKPARKGSKEKPVSVRNKDILSLNEQHWADVYNDTKTFQEAINNFQLSVIGSQFPEIDCPYPITASIYVGLFWKFKKENNIQWTKDRLDEIFSAFFWMNCLCRNYETDSLGVGKDMNKISSLLKKFANKSDKDWYTAVNDWLNKDIASRGSGLPTKGELVLDLQGKPTGARKQTLALPIKYKAKKDIIDINLNIDFPANDNIEIHHIFPRNWIQNNSNNLTFPNNHSDENTINELRECLANMTPLAANSNLKWKAKSPKTIISSFTNKGQGPGKDIWTNRFIFSNAHQALISDQPEPFLKYRAEAIADWLLDQTNI